MEKRNMMALAAEYGVIIESIETIHDATRSINPIYRVTYGFGETEDYLAPEDAYEAIRAYGAGSR